MKLDDSAVYLLAIAGFDQGKAAVVRSLKRLGWGVHVHVAEPLDERDRCFSEDSRIFPDAALRDEARSLAFERGERLEPKAPLGFGKSEAAVCFEFQCPNNTLPIVWKAADGWEPLFPRR